MCTQKLILNELKTRLQVFVSNSINFSINDFLFLIIFSPEHSGIQITSYKVFLALSQLSFQPEKSGTLLVYFYSSLMY